MKRSEFMENMKPGGLSAGPIWLAAARAAAALIEEAGWKWEPEEEPLPERIAFGPITENGDLRPALKAEGHLEGGYLSRRQEIGTYSEAVRRYNAWPELEEMVARLKVWAGGTVWAAEERRYMEAAVRALREFLSGGLR